MKLYLSFGYVDENEVPHRLFHLEEPLDSAAFGRLVGFCKRNLEELI